MWDALIGLVIMVGLFGALLGGMLVVTRADEGEVEPGDLLIGRHG